MENDWKGKEKELYEKWKKEHPDVMHTKTIFPPDFTEGTPHEWWVRNYVESRLLPWIESQKKESFEEGYVAGKNSHMTKTSND